MTTKQICVTVISVIAAYVFITWLFSLAWWAIAVILLVAFLGLLFVGMAGSGGY